MCLDISSEESTVQRNGCFQGFCLAAIDHIDNQ